MLPRTTLIAVLVGVELALVFGMVVAVGGGPSAQASYRRAPGTVSQAPQSFAAGARPALAIDVGMADVVIDAAPSSQIVVSVSDAHPHVGSSVPISAHNDNGTIHITAAETDAWSFLGDSRTIHIAAPPETAVTIAEAGDITINGLRADATIASGAHFHPGDGIIIRDYRGDLTASSSSGVINVADADCTAMHVTTSNGRITLSHVKAARIDASSSNGRVDGTGLNLRDGRITTSNGRVSLGFAPGSDATVTAGTANGHISVTGFSAEPAKLVKSASDDEDDDDDDSAAAQSVRVGAGTGRLDVRASNGSIHLSQEG